MNKRILSVFVFSAALLSIQAQDRKGGISDAIKRAEGQLYEMESRLGFVKKWNGIKTTLGDIINCAEEISDYNLNHGLSREINDTTVKIKSLALSIIE